MQDSEMIEKIYKLQSESNERDARLETKISYLSERMEKTEELLEKMSEVLNSQKHLSSVVDTLAVQVGSLKATINEHEKKIIELETAPAKKTYQMVSKIVWVVISFVVTAILSSLVWWGKK